MQAANGANTSDTRTTQWTLLGFLFLFFGLTQAACTTQTTAVAVRGTVVEARSGKPISGAAVTALDGSHRETITDREGRFSLSAQWVQKSLIRWNPFAPADHDLGAVEVRLHISAQDHEDVVISSTELSPYEPIRLKRVLTPSP